MQFQEQPNPYPVHAHHSIAGAAILEVMANLQAPDGVIAIPVMTSIVVACQGFLDVKLPTGQTAPTTQSMMVFAESGERKSAADSLVFAPIIAFDEQSEVDYKVDIKRYTADLQVWEVINSELNRKLAQGVRNNQPLDSIKQQIEEHINLKPAKPRCRRILRQNATARALIDALEGDGESIAFLSAEGHTVLSGGVASHFGLLNQAWDGPRRLVFDRAGENILIRNPRVSCSLMVQPKIWRDYVEKRGEVARGSGFFARVLFAWPASTQGLRFASTLDVQWRHLDAFHQRITELLEEHKSRSKCGTIDRVVLEFSPEAKALWLQLQNSIEEMLRPNDYLSDMPDFASKMMEITGRLAATMHYFARQEGQISVDTLNRSKTIVEWHMFEFKRIFAPAPSVPQLLLDAQALSQYLNASYFMRGILSIPRNHVLQCGPVRGKASFAPALEYLEASGKIWIGIGPKKTRYINAGPLPH